MKNYDNFFLPAGDLNEGKRFYRDVLGLPVKFDFAEKGMVAFQVGNEEAAIILKSVPEAKPTIWFEVEDVRVCVQDLTEKGVQFIGEPFRIRTGWAVEFDDPFGNRLGITDYRAK